jgi:hypothetical protein
MLEVVFECKRPKKNFFELGKDPRVEWASPLEFVAQKWGFLE